MFKLGVLNIVLSCERWNGALDVVFGNRVSDCFLGKTLPVFGTPCPQADGMSSRLAAFGKRICYHWCTDVHQKLFMQQKVIWF